MFHIAIDGPGGAGKSSVAKAVAKKLNIIYVDTGALYRTVGLYVKQNGVDPKNAESVAALLPSLTITVGYENGTQVVYLNGVNYGDAIRTPEMSMYASDVSAIPAVRAFLLGLQRSIIKSNNVIMDGRDIGTVIMPDANVKIFLISNNETRAQRRCEELILKGVQTTYEEVLADLEKRDANDSSRAVAPLVPAPDATFLDNSLFTPDQTFARALEIIRERIDV